MRFRAAQHLRRQGDIRAVREQGRRVEGRAFTVWWRARPLEASGTAVSTELVRAGFVASRHAVGGAVRRNRAKRRLRELFRRNQSLAPARCDLLIIARSGTLDRPFSELERTFVDVCGRIQPPAQHR